MRPSDVGYLILPGRPRVIIPAHPDAGQALCGFAFDCGQQIQAAENVCYHLGFQLGEAARIARGYEGCAK